MKRFLDIFPELILEKILFGINDPVTLKNFCDSEPRIKFLSKNTSNLSLSIKLEKFKILPNAWNGYEPKENFNQKYPIPKIHLLILIYIKLNTYIISNKGNLDIYPNFQEEYSNIKFIKDNNLTGIESYIDKIIRDLHYLNTARHLYNRKYYRRNENDWYISKDLHILDYFFEYFGKHYPLFLELFLRVTDGWTLAQTYELNLNNKYENIKISFNKIQEILPNIIFSIEPNQESNE